MLQRINRVLEPATFQILLASLIGLLNIVYEPLGLPSSAQIIKLAEGFFAQYGLWVLFVAALLEGLFMISIYFPGSFVIFITVLLSDRTLITLVQIGVVAWVGFMLVGAVNYLLGRYGWYKILVWLDRANVVDKMKRDLQKYGNRAIFFSAFHPSFLSIMQVSAGISKLGMMRTLALSGISLVFWIALWEAIVTPLLNTVNVEDTGGSGWIMVGVVLLWGVFNIISERQKKNREI